MAKKGTKDQTTTHDTEHKQPAPAVEATTVAEVLAETGPTEAVTAAQQEIETLKSQLAEAQSKAEDYLDRYTRALADFQNLRRRTEREQLTANQNATTNVIKRYLEIFDDLERALKNRPKDGEAAQWAEGVDLAYRKFLNFLEAEGVTRISAEGMAFDPTQHEAISQEDSPEHASGMVIGVVQQGYRLGDRVLRPARVRVAR